ncbi:MAG: hypothetical protein H7831_08040 [Magnetococcus sp. WYHC-3]
MTVEERDRREILDNRADRLRSYPARRAIVMFLLGVFALTWGVLWWQKPDIMNPMGLVETIAAGQMPAKQVQSLAVLASALMNFFFAALMILLALLWQGWALERRLLKLCAPDTPPAEDHKAVTGA